MKIENRIIKPEKWWSYEEKPILMFKLVDDWVNYHSKDKYDRRWQNRCNNCLSLCCYFSMLGYRYNYSDDGNNSRDMQDFWEHMFVIMVIKNLSWKETVEMGFNITVNPEEFKKRGLQFCPLAIPEGCLIYEDRPKMCKEWRCMMSLSKYIGTK